RFYSSVVWTMRVFLLYVPFSFFSFIFCYGVLLDLHSFPTRRSSDLGAGAGRSGGGDGHRGWRRHRSHGLVGAGNLPTLASGLYRSEEHTSELQSRFDLVCRLLLEKKNMKNPAY